MEDKTPLQELSEIIYERLPRLISAEMSEFLKIRKPILLSDVLEVLGERYFIYGNGSIGIEVKSMVEYFAPMFWDLTKPHLSDQSEELINSLLKIVK